MIALVAVFALLVQALIPTLAAAGNYPGEGLSVCTEAGLAPAPDGSSAPASAGHDCQHCVCPAATAEAAPAVVSIGPVVYLTVAAPVTETPRGLRPHARAAFR